MRRRRTVQSTACRHPHRVSRPCSRQLVVTHTGCRHPHRSADRAVVTHTGQRTVQSSPAQVSGPCSRHPHRSADRAVVTHTGQRTVQSSSTQVSGPCSRHAHRSAVRPTRHDAAGQAGAASLQPDAETPSSLQICQRTGERTVRA